MDSLEETQKNFKHVEDKLKESDEANANLKAELDTNSKYMEHYFAKLEERTTRMERVYNDSFARISLL